MNNFLITVVGPTAIGKTSLSIRLAQYFNTEIISADSRQFFKEMQIGTAAPTTEELSKAKHHFIRHKSINEDYSVGHFEKEAISSLNQLFENYKEVVMVGGSGLYVDAVTNGLDDFPKVDPQIREHLNSQLKSEGIEALQSQLKELDLKSHSVIDIQNPQRLIRALEICIGTNKPFSSYKKIKNTKRNFKTIYVGLTADRKIIYDRINQRVDLMIKNGQLEEAKKLYKFKHLNALNTVGYKELFKHFDGEWTLDFAISEIKKNTRRFAKRQLTWFRKNEQIMWFDYQDDFKYIIDEIKKRMTS
jgi:tRNA dimethylallyltransferase